MWCNCTFYLNFIALPPSFLLLSAAIHPNQLAIIFRAIEEIPSSWLLFSFPAEKMDLPTLISSVFQGLSSNAIPVTARVIMLSFGKLCLYFSSTLREFLTTWSSCCKVNNRLDNIHRTKRCWSSCLDEHMWQVRNSSSPHLWQHAAEQMGAPTAATESVAHVTAEGLGSRSLSDFGRFFYFSCCSWKTRLLQRGTAKMNSWFAPM